MIQKYEGFLNLFKKNKKSSEVPSIGYEDMLKLSNDSFIELVDKGYTVKNKFNEGDPYVQITKHRGSLQRSIEIPYDFIDVKDDVLSFTDRIKDHKINVNYAFVYDNDMGGFSIDNPKYEDFENGDYDNRDVSILTIYIDSTNIHYGGYK